MADVLGGPEQSLGLAGTTMRRYERAFTGFTSWCIANWKAATMYRREEDSRFGDSRGWPSQESGWACMVATYVSHVAHPDTLEKTVRSFAALAEDIISLVNAISQQPGSNSAAAGRSNRWAAVRAVAKRLDRLHHITAPRKAPSQPWRRAREVFSITRLLLFVHRNLCTRPFSLDLLRTRAIVLHAVDRASRRSELSGTMRSTTKQTTLSFSSDGYRETMSINTWSPKNYASTFGNTETVTECEALPLLCSVRATHEYMEATAPLCEEWACNPLRQAYEDRCRGRQNATRKRLPRDVECEGVQLFVVHEGSERGRGITDDFVSSILRGVLERAHIPGTAHTIRAAVASYLIAKGVADNHVLKRGGWKYATTVSRHYAKHVVHKSTVPGEVVSAEVFTPAPEERVPVRTFKDMAEQYGAANVPDSWLLRSEFFSSNAAAAAT